MYMYNVQSHHTYFHSTVFHTPLGFFTMHLSLVISQVVSYSSWSVAQEEPRSG